MANEQNLIPGNQPGGHTLTQEEQSAGGKASGRKRRLQGAIERALDCKAPDEDFGDLFRRFGIQDDESKTFASAMACALVNKAAQGNLDAIAMTRDTIGEKPSEDINLNGGVVIVDDLANKN
jgi:hypothetical protein